MTHDWVIEFTCGNVCTWSAPAGEWQPTEQCGNAYRLAVGRAQEIAKAVNQGKAEERERVLILIENWETDSYVRGWQEMERGARAAVEYVRFKT